MENKVQYLIIRGVMQRLFRCKRCGACCIDSEWLAIDPVEVPRLAKALNIPLKKFVRKYIKQDGREFSLISNPCKLYDKDKGCKVYKDRPLVCRGFPFAVDEHYDENPFRPYFKDVDFVDERGIRHRMCPGTEEFQTPEMMMEVIKKLYPDRDPKEVRDELTKDVITKLIKDGIIDEDMNLLVMLI